MIGAGIVPAREGIEVAGLEDPELAVGERILVFLERIPDEESPGVPIVVPSGFDPIARVPDGLWRDVRSSSAVSSRDIQQKVVLQSNGQTLFRQCQHGDRCT